MNIEQAIAILKYYRPVAAFNAGFKGPQSEDVKAFNLAIEALKKQMPAKIEKSNTRAYGYCPECGKVFWDKWENEYCESCGQKLDWSEV